MVTIRARRLVASAVVLVLAGTPIAASACALWCPPGTSHGAGATSVAAAGADTECAAWHHDAATPADDTPRATADSGARPGNAMASTPMPPAAAIVAAPACCDVPVVDAGAAVAPIEGVVALAPLPASGALCRPADPPRAMYAHAIDRPVATRVPRVHVLRI